MRLLLTKALGLAAVLLLLATSAATLAACGGGDDPGAAATAPTTAASRDQGWERIDPGGDCRCSDGSEFSFWIREANPKKVVLYLQDGGACFSAETCAPENDLYNVKVDDGPTGKGGIFDFADARNPFAGHSVVYVPYCTADVHIGNATTEYAPGLTVEHAGYVNGTAALEHLAATFPGASEVVVVGESAGSVASPLYAGLVSDRLPDARITVLAHGSGSYPDLPEFNRLIAAWGFENVAPPWLDTHWSFPELFVQSGRRDSEIVFARIDYAYDSTQASWFPYLGVPATDLLSRIEANETQIEAARVDVHSYIAPGEEHVVFDDGPFYTETVNGVKLVDWVSRLVDGEPVDDVHCRQCRIG
jgi:hypothetical protein